MKEFRHLLAVAAVLDYDRRRRNYEEFSERLTGNIDRWEDQLKRNRDSQDRTEETLNQNHDRLQRLRDVLTRLDSSDTRKWLEHKEKQALEHRKPEVRQLAATKVKEHHEKRADIEQKIARYRTWISQGNDKIESLENRARDLRDKISNARGKLRD